MGSGLRGGEFCGEVGSSTASTLNPFQHGVGLCASEHEGTLNPKSDPVHVLRLSVQIRAPRLLAPLRVRGRSPSFCCEVPNPSKPRPGNICQQMAISTSQLGQSALFRHTICIIHLLKPQVVCYNRGFSFNLKLGCRHLDRLSGSTPPEPRQTGN